MSDTQVPADIPAPAAPAAKFKRNISDEERKRRSDRMKEISAKRLADLRASKTPKPPAAAPAAAAIEAPKLSLKPPVEDSEDLVEKIVNRLKNMNGEPPQPPKKQPARRRVPVEESESEDEDIRKEAPAPKKQPTKPKGKSVTVKEEKVKEEPPKIVYEAPKRGVRFF